MAASYNESLAASWELPPATFVILSCHQHCLHSTRLSFLPPHPPPSLPPLYSSYQRNFLTLRVPAAAYLPLPSQPYHLRSYLHTLPTFKYLFHYQLMSYNSTFLYCGPKSGWWALVPVKSEFLSAFSSSFNAGQKVHTLC